MKSRLLFLTLSTLLAFAAASLGGCRKKADTESASKAGPTPVESGNRTQTLHLGNIGEPNDLDPHVGDSHETFNIISALFEGLAQYDAKTSEPVPAAAERWETSPDGLVWTFHLRKAAKWSNGDPLTAHDFVFGFQRMLSPNLAAQYAQTLYVLKNAEAYNTGKITDASQIGARALDDHTLELSLDHPVPYLAGLVCHSAWYPIHRATIEKFGAIDQRGLPWTRPGNIVSNGYFILADWRPNQFIRLTKSPTYWDRDNVKLNEVLFHPIESADAEERAFRSGQLHITRQVPIPKIATYRKERPDVLKNDPVLSIYYYSLNTEKPPLTDARVRRALALAIDRDQIVKFVTRGGQLPAGHFTPPGTAGFTAQAVTGTDIPTAQKLLAEAGFPGGKGFPRIEILYNTSEGHKSIAEAIQQMWKKNLGVDIGLYNQEAKVWLDSMRQKNYQISRAGWGGDYLDPSTFLDIMLGDSGNNHTNWKNPEYDRVLLEARNTSDQAKRFENFQRAEQILSEDMPIIPIYFYVRNTLVLPEVKGWYGNLLDHHPLKGVYLQP
ncbi:peptide ABC transporter substrate-binding protein [Nibricoccus aquaticus]|uniref:Peptide ABC transporter substrate-binding protein n=1 Tax=Nibricoccus aquaticus TaxID=2576891 RepID=A0A290QLM1_9BACT|nr:peptide ABC transporter substrate-binding protein [Nibricoccus aquaticus]ATC64922.1 peptide ABC transporter substrate-binding protein [Nibricoccus aquaticus]